MSVVEKDYLPQFAAEAVHDLEYIAKNVCKAYGNTELSRSLAHTNKQVANLIREAVHLVVPENGEIYRSCSDFPTEEESVSSVGIPAPVITIEHAMPNNDKPPEVYYEEGVKTFGHGCKQQTNPTACLLIVMDVDQFSGTIEITPDLNGGTPVSIMGLQKFSVPVMNAFPNIKWGLNQYGINIIKPIKFDRSTNKDGEEDCRLRSSIYNIYKDHVTDIEAERELPELLRMKIRSGFFKSINTLIQTCHSLRVGATFEARKEKSYTRSRTFEKKGVGSFEYHVLKLPTGTVRETLGSRVGSDRDGPRYHFRRAHLRSLSTGTQTFVRSCFVGNKEKGVVEKEYNIPKAQA